MIVIVLVSGYVQQAQIQGRASNQNVNPQQQMIMKILPLFIGVISFGLPGALVLYFVTSNLFRVGQQFLITHTIYKDDAEAVGVIEAHHEEKPKDKPKDKPAPKKSAGSSSSNGSGSTGTKGKATPPAAAPPPAAACRRARTSARPPGAATARPRRSRRCPSPVPARRRGRPVEWVQTTGKTIEEAKERALDELGVDDRDAEFEVLEEPRSGLFGLSRGDAKVRARVRPTSPRPKQERGRRRSGGGNGRSRGGGGGGGAGPQPWRRRERRRRPATAALRWREELVRAQGAGRWRWRHPLPWERRWPPARGLSPTPACRRSTEQG